MDFQNLESELYKDIEEEILFSVLEEEAEKELEKEKTLKKPKNKKKKRNNTYTAKKAETILKSGLKIKTVILLLLTLLVNTYAWFIYISTVSMGISMHVKNWSFELSNGDQNQNFEFIVDEIFPGMATQVYEINAKNSGETIADLSCDISSIKILDEEYVQGETYIEDGVEKTYTSEKLFEILTSYPFKIQVYFDDVLYQGVPIPMSTDDETSIKFQVEWEYETGTEQVDIDANDIEDTYWGKRAYEYKQTNPDDYSIRVDVKILAIQNTDDVANP